MGSCVAVAAALLPQHLRGLIQLQQQHAAGSATPVLVTHGSKDTEVSLSRVQATVAAAERTGMLACLHCAHSFSVHAAGFASPVAGAVSVCKITYLCASLDLVFQHLWLIRQTGQSWRRAFTMACQATQLMASPARL